MAEVAITVGPVETAADYTARMDRIKDFVGRLHIDISDGVFTPTKTIDLAQVYEVDEVPSDLHLMVSHPGTLVEMVISMGPNLVICAAEAAANWPELFGQWQEVGIKVGLALRTDTPVSQIEHMLPTIDHVLVFTGDHMGFNHSQFEPKTLDKIKEIRTKDKRIEIGVDGGMNPEHAKAAMLAGADVINTGGYVVDAKNPRVAYGELLMALEVKHDRQTA